jgi:hypothetical protein
MHVSSGRALAMTSWQYVKLMSVYTQQSIYHYILESFDVLNNIIHYCCLVGGVVEILIEWIPRFFLWDYVTVLTLTFFSGVFCFHK